MGLISYFRQRLRLPGPQFSKESKVDDRKVAKSSAVLKSLLGIDENTNENKNENSDVVEKIVPLESKGKLISFNEFNSCRN